jgi:dTDP-4-amino-4,6-dideoxygalactose transaminase
MYIPTFQGLSASDFVRPVFARGVAKRYPFDVSHRTFYRARNAIYHLFDALKDVKAQTNGRLCVLVPDYNSGNEVLAIEAAGADVRFYGVGADGQADVAEVERLCDEHTPDVLYVIHYLGWPQPIRQLAGLAERRGTWLVEDCALALLSDAGTQPLGTFGHWSVFCLYKTLPVPNGACLVENRGPLPALDRVSLRRAGLPSVLGRTAELVVRNIRSRSESLGAAMHSMKRAAGRAAGAMDVPRARVGDIGFSIDDVDLAMSDISALLIRQLDFEDIRRRRIANYRRLAGQLDGFVTPLHAELPEGACPLLFPILVHDKPSVAQALRRSGVDALEFWNHGAESLRRADADGPARPDSPNTRFLRDHVLGLPVHQDLTARHIDYVAAQTARLDVRLS